MITTYFKNIVAGSVYHASDAPGTLPVEYYFGISSSLPNADGSGVTEPSQSAGYERSIIAGLKMSDKPGVVTNGTVISTSESTQEWGTFPYFTIWNAKTGGNLLGYGSFNEPKVIGTNSMITIKIGALELSVEHKPDSP